MKLMMITPWHTIVDDLTRGGRLRTSDLMRYEYNKQPSSGALWAGLAQVYMVQDPVHGPLSQKYALEFYKNNREWIALIAAAEDALFFSALRVIAISDLLQAAVHLEHPEYIARYAQRTCDFHTHKLLSSPQLLTVFFNAIMPYYHRSMHTESILAVRRVLRAYNPALSDLLYTHLQAKLYAYTTTIAEKLAGERDPLLPR